MRRPVRRYGWRFWQSTPPALPTGFACRNHFLTAAGETPRASARERGVSPVWRRPPIKARIFGAGGSPGPAAFRNPHKPQNLREQTIETLHLTQVAKKPLDFFEKDLPQLVYIERFLPDQRIPCDWEGLQVKFPRRPVFPKLSIVSANSSRKSAKRRRSDLSCRANQKLVEFSNRPPVFSRKRKPGGFGGKVRPFREPASTKIVWAA